MIKVIVSISAALIFLGSAAADAGIVLDRVMARHLLVGAVSDGFPPVAFLDPATGELAGFDVDITRAIAARLKVDVKLVTPSWDMTVAGRWADRFDLAVGSMTPTRDRMQVLNFPAVYYRVPVSFAVHVGAKGINSVADLKGKRVGLCSACSSEAWFDGTMALMEPVAPSPAPGMIKLVYEGEGTAFDDLKLGPGKRLDAVLSNRPTIEAAIAKGYPFRLLSPDAFDEPLAVAVDKGDPEFADAIAKAVADLKRDGTLGRLSVKWFGVDLTR